MKRSVALTFFLLLVCSVTIAAQSDENWDASGTGFLITSTGYILTAAHVVEGASQIRVVLNGRSWDASILSQDNAHDIAALSIQASGLPYLSIADSNKVLLGEDVSVVGFPLAFFVGTSMKITRGTISGIGPINTVKCFQVDAPVNPGNSGGPLLNNKGQVIGIITSKINPAFADSIGFAIPINYANPLLKQDYIIPTTGAITNQPLDGTSIARIAQQSVVYILVKKSDGKNDMGKDISSSVSTRNLYLYDKDNNLRGILSTDVDPSNPWLCLYSKGGNSSVVLGFDRNEAPYVNLMNTNKKAVHISFSTDANPGVWLYDDTGDARIGIALTQNGSTIYLNDPTTDESQIQLVSDSINGNRILVGDDTKYWRIVLNSSSKGTYITTYDRNGSVLWSSY